MKDFSLKQSIMIVAGGAGMLLVCIFLLGPFLGGTTPNKVTTTRNEEEQLGNAIVQYAVVFQKYPTNDNAGLTKNLTGDNPKQLTLLNLMESSTNKDGQMIDVWGTPYQFTFNSTNNFAIRSAGENHTFGDMDDVVFSSVTNNLPKP
jgi:hypothetical protein